MRLLRTAGLLALATAVLAGCPETEATEAAAGSASASTSAPVPSAKPQVDQKARAEALAKKLIIVDGHVDLPYRLEGGRDAAGKLTEDPTKATDEGDFDYPRAKRGGLDAPFMSIYIPARHQKEGGAKALADKLIDMVEDLPRRAPDKFALAPSVAALRKNFEAGKVSLPMGIENGAALEGRLENVAHFHGRGVRYITLTHSKDNDICDSSYDETHTHKGLSAFGKKVVAEMNRVGIMVDVSHISDDAFQQVMELSEAPVIASHSSCRHFTPGFERNMSDAMIKKLAAKNGVIMINFGSSFVDQKARTERTKAWKARSAFAEKNGLKQSDAKVKAFAKDYAKTHDLPFATVEVVADHITHVVELVGIDHVGLGSDFDGVGDSLPTGLKDASQLPNLIRTLLARGYDETAIEKILSGNVLRVWQAVERHAAKAGGN